MKGKKGLIIFLAVIMVVGTSFSTGFAQTGAKTIQGWFDNNIKIYNNGVQVNLKETPIIKEGATGGTTYVAIRELGEILNKNVTWDQANYSAYIVDKPDQNYQKLLLDNLAKTEEITKLESKVEELEKELKELKEAKEDKTENLYDLERKLDRTYGVYKTVRLDIILRGDKDEVIVDIVVANLDRTQWNSLTDRERKILIEDIVYDIQREYKNAKVKGYLESGSRDTSLDFYTDYSGYVKYYGTGSGSGSGSGAYLSPIEMAYFLEDQYRDIWRATVTVTGYYVDVDVDLAYYLSPSEITTLVNNIKTDIIYEMEDVNREDITVRVYERN